MLSRDKVELFPCMLTEDWVYAFELARKYRADLTQEILTQEWLHSGFQCFIGYANGKRAGVVFSKEWEDGLTIDGYVDYAVLKPGVAVWYSMTAAVMMMNHLHRYTNNVYGIFKKKDLRVAKFAKLLQMEYFKEWKDFFIYKHKFVINEMAYATEAGYQTIGEKIWDS